MFLRLLSIPVALAACGTETPRTTKPDAGMPVAPFNVPAKVVGADAGQADAGGADAGGADAGQADAGEGDASAPAPVSSALLDVKPFTIAIVGTSAGELRMESSDRQTFVIRTKGPAGTWFATKEPDLRAGELARWGEQPGGATLSFRRAGDRVVVARWIGSADAGTASSKEFRFAFPAGATLFVESRALHDAGSP